MAVTPTVMIAAQGMLAGEGVGVNSNMTSTISGATDNPITGGISALQTQATSLAESNAPAAASLTAALNSLPSAFTSVNSAATSATSQAESMVPDVKTFITLHSSSTAFGSATAEYGAALQQFGDKSFGDLGIGVSSFTDANSGGLTSLVPGMGALAASAKNDAFGGIGANLDPSALAKGQAQMASSALGDGLKSVGQGIGNFGSLMDFKNPQQLGFQSLVSNLQQLGLADSVGINDGISAAGFDPKNLGAIPDSVLQNILSGVQGDDLQKIITQTGAKPVGTANSAADLVDPSIMMPPGATAALGIKPGSGLSGLKSLGNTFTNIGVPMDGASASKLLGAVQTNVGSYLSALTSLVPTSVSSALTPFLGSGSSPFGTPSMSDMMGSVSGKHTADFTSAGNQLGSIAGSSQGQGLVSAMTAVLAAITSGSGLTAALSALTSASSSFSSQAASNSSLSSSLSSITQSMSNVTSHISLENSNLSLAGLSLGSLPSSPLGSGQILSFASKLHSFGVDKQQLGHNDIFNGVATDDLTGDAIKASLLEGKNVAAMASAGKTPPSVSNQTQALADANAGNFDSFVQAFETAATADANADAATDLAKQALVNSIPSEMAANKAAYQAALAAGNTAFNAKQDAENKMFSAATNSTDAATAQAAVQKYLN